MERKGNFHQQAVTWELLTQISKKRFPFLTWIIAVVCETAAATCVVHGLPKTAAAPQSTNLYVVSTTFF